MNGTVAIVRADGIFFGAGARLATWLLLGGAVAGLVGTMLPAFGYFPPLGQQELVLDHWAKLFAMPGLFVSSLLSLTTGFFATAISFLIAMVVLAYAHGTKGFGLLRHLLSPILSVPHAAVAMGLALVIAPSGLIFRLAGFERPPDWLIVHDPWGLSLMAGLILKEVPFLFLVSLAALPQLRTEPQLHVARLLGYGRVTAFAKVILPQLYARIRLPLLAVLSYSAAPPEMALILGPQDPPLLVVMILRWMNAPELDLRMVASAGAVLQLVLVVALIFFWRGLEILAARLVGSAAASGDRSALELPLRIGGVKWSMIFGVVISLALVSLLLWSVAASWRFPELLPPDFTLTHWARALSSAGGPLLTSFWIGLAVAGFSLLLVAASLERQESRLGEIAVYAPLILPQIAILMGLQWLILPFGTAGIWPAVLLAHLIFVLPYVWLSLSGPWRGFDRRYELAALSLGARPSRVFWRVRVPMLVAPLLTAFAVGFAVSAGLYLPSLLPGGGRVVTITTEAVALSSGGDRRVIAIYALLQGLLPFVGFVLALGLPGLLFRNRRGMRGA
jgi:putative thiamine transport system permease protein